MAFGWIVGVIVILVVVLVLKDMRSKAAGKYRADVNANECSVVVSINERKEKIRRHPHFQKEFIRFMYADVRTLYQAFRRGAKIAGNGPCMGVRADGVSPFLFESYEKVLERINNFGAGLIQLGLKAGQKTLLGLWSKNCPEFVIAEHGGYCHNMINVPLYDTLGDDAVCYILRQTALEIVICDSDKIGKLRRVLEENANSSAAPLAVKYVVKMSSVNEEERSALKSLGVEVFSFKTIEENGRLKPTPHTPPQPEDFCTICYTSGTTGDPKGVLLSHANLIADAAAVQYALGNVRFSPKDVHLSYLPLAHMFERSIHVHWFTEGAQMGFLRNQDPSFLLEDLKELKPTFFGAVPRVLNRVYSGLLKKVKAKGPVVEKIFHWAVNKKIQQLLEEGVLRQDSFYDKLFKDARLALGGRVRLLVTGAAPISQDTLNFFRAVFGCHVVEGYGMSEMAAAATLSLPGVYGSVGVGPVLACNEIKLVSVPELNYLVEEDKGEVCYRGTNQFAGYYRDQARTDEAVDAEGWLHSGDIGEFLPNGCLKIIDRKKAIFKLNQGEYVAPEKIENVYIRMTGIAQAFVHGESIENCLVGIIVVDADAFVKLCNDAGIKGDLIALCAEQRANTLLLRELNAFGSANGLKGFEQVRAIHLESAPFTIENGLLTPTMKAKRAQLKERFLPEIQKLYGQLHQMKSKQ